MRANLFRQKAIEQQQLGYTFLAQPLSFRIITLITATLFLLTLLFLFLSHPFPYLSGQLAQNDKCQQTELTEPLRLLDQLPVDQTVQLAYLNYSTTEFGHHEGRFSGEYLVHFSDHESLYRISIFVDNRAIRACNRDPLQLAMHVEASIAGSEQPLLERLFNRSSVSNV